MKMYMKRNVNFALLGLVITVLVCTVIITTYFQSTYKDVSTELEEKKGQLETINSNFSSKLRELNKTASELQLRQLDKDKLDQLYTDLTGAKEMLDAELESTREKLNQTLIAFERKSDELLEVRYVLLTQENELSELRAKVENQLGTIRSKTAEIDTLKSQLCEEKKAQGKTC